MDSQIQDHLERLVKFTNALKEIRRTSKKEFLENHILQSASERYLQMAIESCLNIGNRIIASEQFQHQVEVPETYADIFRELAKIGVIDSEFSEDLQKMAKFRNRLVHMYWEIDREFVYEILQSKLETFEKFIQSVVEFYRDE